MVDLMQALSNPVGPLKAVLEAADRPNRAGRSRPSGHPHKPPPRRPGWVVKAVVQVLAARQEPMQARDIHAAVEALLEEPVCWSSVKASLAANITGLSPRFMRVAPGRYILAKE
jgi:hypothetical protein